jgi:hypothetical protein
VTLAWVTVNRRIRISGERRLDRGLGGLRHELIFLGQMQQQRRVQTVNLAEILFRVATIVGTRNKPGGAAAGLSQCRDKLNIS